MILKKLQNKMVLKNFKWINPCKSARLCIFKHYSKFNPYTYSIDTYFMGRGKKRKEYIDIALGFDIETTSTCIDDDKVAWAYHFQFCFGQDCYYGRNLSDVKYVFDDISEWAGDRMVICWIHNLSYEFGFLTEYLKFEDIFATAPNHPIKCRYKNIIFRCSYAFSNMSLSLLAKTYCQTQKGVDDLDYRIIRYPNTPLSIIEKLYCYKDVKILSEFYYNHIAPTYLRGKKRKWLPLTNTAKVRNDMQKRIRNYNEYKKIYSSVYPTEEIYNILRLCFYGGIVRANAMYFSKVLSGVASRDRKSSYPAVQFQYLYPMGRFYRIDPKKETDFDNKEYVKMYNVTFLNLKCIAPISIMPYDKAKTSRDVVLDNGRIFKASVVSIYCTNIDLSLWKKFYTGSVKINECWISKKGRLCRFQIESLFDYYIGKKKYKGVAGKEDIYLKKKNMLNSNFGCCVQKHNDETLTYNYNNGEWLKEPIPYQQKQSEFLLYQVGVWITAYARMELLTAMYEIWQYDLKHNLPSAIVYGDTDSCKYLYRNGIYEHIFDKLDKEIQLKTKKACEYYNLDYDSLSDIGTWDLETHIKGSDIYTYDTFITLGSKRYLHNGQPTISGLPIQGFKNYCTKHNLTPEKAFRCGTYFSENDINKICMTYRVNPKQYIISNDGIDYITPHHYVYAQNVGFKLDIGSDYSNFLSEYMELTNLRGDFKNE